MKDESPQQNQDPTIGMVSRLKQAAMAMEKNLFSPKKSDIHDSSSQFYTH